MARILDLVRNSQLPANQMQFAARGALLVPPGEMIEILVHLALHNKLFGEQARMTLAGWDEKASRAAAADPTTSAQVLEYFVTPDNLRIALLPVLTENPSVGEEPLSELAAEGSRAVVEVFLQSQRVMKSARLLHALKSNPSLRPNEIAEMREKHAALAGAPTAEHHEADVHEALVPEEVVEGTLAKYLEENAAEVAAEAHKPFQPVRIEHEEAGAVVPPAAAAVDSASAAAEKVSTEQSAAATAHPKVQPHPDEHRRDSALQKISRLGIQGRISLAMRGTKEERAILIRDSTKLVSCAVLDSPKVSEGEVEGFAQQKNVLVAVLRAIPMKRKFAKNYSITRNLVFNPRTPLDLSLGLMKNLLVHDLKNLAGNKDVPDTIRKLALRMFKQRTEKKE
jgi:hypothetical protein